MFADTKAFSSFSVNNVKAAKEFYGGLFGLEVRDQPMGFVLQLKSGGQIFVYPKDNHTPASFTILNFPVDNIDKAVDELTKKGITFEQYNNSEMPQDDKGIMRGLSAKLGPDIAWFKDPAGNILAILQES
ncbi:MAG TPA: VOC family protein [Candidatus Saccharimonadales bacterium]